MLIIIIFKKQLACMLTWQSMSQNGKSETRQINFIHVFTKYAREFDSDHAKHTQKQMTLITSPPSGQRHVTF